MFQQQQQQQQQQKKKKKKVRSWILCLVSGVDKLVALGHGKKIPAYTIIKCMQRN